MSEREMWQAVVAQAIADAGYIIENPRHFGKHPGWRSMTKPTRLESFMAWRWLWDERNRADREKVFNLAGMDADFAEDLFSRPKENLAQIRTLRTWARRFLRET